MHMLHFEQKSISGVEYPLICFSKSISNKSIGVVNAKMFLVLWALKDDTRMVQLRMHVTGDAERTISGLGLRGVMYATALKTLKENFGQPSVIARAFIRKITERKKIQPDDRQVLREFSLDMTNCLATLRQINYFANVNTNDNLRKIVRSSDWKVENVVTGIRETSEIPQL